MICRWRVQRYWSIRLIQWRKPPKLLLWHHQAQYEDRRFSTSRTIPSSHAKDIYGTRDTHDKNNNNAYNKSTSVIGAHEQSETLITQALLSLDKDFFAGDEREVYERLIPQDLRSQYELGTKSLSEVLKELLLIHRTNKIENTLSADGVFALYRYVSNSQSRNRTVDDEAIVLFATALYERASYKHCVTVLLDNLSMVDFVSAVAEEIVPKFVYKGEHRTYILGNLGLALTELQEDALVMQLFQESFDGDIEKSEAFFEIIKDVNRGAISGVLEGGRPIDTKSENETNNHQDIDYFYRWAYSRVAIRECLENLDKLPKLFSRWFVAGEEGHYALRQALLQLYAASETSGDLRYSIVEGLARGIKGLKPNKVLRDEELSMFPLFAGYKSVKAHQRLCRSFKHYLKRRPSIEDSVNVRYRQTLCRLLDGATRLSQSYSIYDLVKLGHGDIYSVRQLASAFESLVWSGKRDPTMDDDQLYIGVPNNWNRNQLREKNQHNGTTNNLLSATIDKCPPKIALKAITKTIDRFYNKYMHRSDNTDNNINSRLRQQSTHAPPGKILWTLLLAIEQSKVINQLPARTEKLLGELVCQRPRLELLRLGLLQTISDAGMISALRTFVDALQRSQHGKYDELDMSVIVGTIVMLNERKLAKAKGSKLPGSLHGDAKVKLGSAVADLFASWNEREAMEILRLLKSKEVLQPTNEEIFRTISLMVKKKAYVLALEFLKLFPKANPSAYHLLLIKSSRDMPQLTAQLSLWMKKERSISTPPEVIRGMIKGFAASPRLTDAQSVKRIGLYMSVLRSQDADLGKKAAMAIVQSTIKRAQLHNNGSRMRLKWALDLAQWEGVSERRVNSWAGVLKRMQMARRGYWSVRRRPIRKRL